MTPKERGELRRFLDEHSCCQSQPLEQLAAEPIGHPGGFLDCQGVPRDDDSVPDIDAMWAAISPWNDFDAMADWLEALLEGMRDPYTERAHSVDWRKRAIELSFRLVGAMRSLHEGTRVK